MTYPLHWDRRLQGGSSQPINPATMAIQPSATEAVARPSDRVVTLRSPLPFATFEIFCEENLVAAAASTASGYCFSPVSTA